MKASSRIRHHSDGPDGEFVSFSSQVPLLPPPPLSLLSEVKEEIPHRKLARPLEVQEDRSSSPPPQLPNHDTALPFVSPPSLPLC
jgi:hypothetical protein